jgi:nitrate/nitrite transporter NarK
MFLVGIGQEAFFALSITMIMETKGVGAAYAGTALGMATTLAALGGFFSPPIGNRLAEINPSFSFAFWAGLSFLSLIILFFVGETGWKKQEVPAELQSH